MTLTPTKAEWLAIVSVLDYSGNTDTDYLEAVYDWANYFAVGNWNDPEYILELAEENYAGEYARDTDYARQVVEEYFSEALDAMHDAADAGNGFIIPFEIDYEQIADLIMPNIQGFNFESYQTSDPGTGAYYFREPR